VRAVAIVDGVTTTQDFAMQPAASQEVSGTVRDTDGNPLENATVQILDTIARARRDRTVRATYSSKRPVASRSRSYRLVSGNGGNQDSRRTIQLS
jgi:hypothetical protein